MRLRGKIFLLSFFVIIFVLANLSLIMAAPSGVLSVRLDGEVNLGMFARLNQAIKEAEEKNYDLLIMEINTTGGLVSAATKIKDLILNARVSTIALVEGRAWSAGALITLCAEKIAMIRGSSIGAAETRPKEEKYISALREEFASVAEYRGRDPQIAAAMVDEDISIPGIIKSGKILTLSAGDAQKHGFCDFLVNSREELLQKIGLQNAEVTEFKSDLKTLFVGWITNPYVAGFLLLLGLGGLLFELTLPGFGASGTIGALALVLFFSGFLILGSTSWFLIILFILGLILLLVEFLVIPGFGVTGIGGILAIGASIFFSFPDPAMAINALAVTVVGLLVVFIVFLRYFSRSRLWSSKISLPLSQKKELGYVAPRKREELLGKRGRTLSILRPAGTAMIEGERVDVVSEGEFIDKDQQIEVFRLEGSKVIVRKVEEK